MGVRISRRSVLAAGVGAAALVGARADEAGFPPSETDVISNRHGRQPGVVDRPPYAADFTAYDAHIVGITQLRWLLRQLTTVLAASSAARVTVTVALGASLFDSRFGLTAQRPRSLSAMPAFPNDVLDSAYCHGDLLVQTCGVSRAAVDQVRASLTEATGRHLRIRWQVEGYRPENTTTADGRSSTRNLFGFREGVGNPDPSDEALMDQLVWVQPGAGEPSWAIGGTYQAVRLIRFSTSIWDTEPVAAQEAVIGRRKQDGAPLGKTRETDDPDYAQDPEGHTVALDAHIRKANPRTAQTQVNRILRRGYSYDRGVDANGTVDSGLVFVCFQQDLERGFATVQRRLAGEALERYVLPFGGGYFFVPPAPASGEFLCSRLLERRA